MAETAIPTDTLLNSLKISLQGIILVGMLRCSIRRMTYKICHYLALI